MLLKGFGRATAGAWALFWVAAAAGQDAGSVVLRGSGGREVAYAAIDTDGLAGAPRYAAGPAMLGDRQMEDGAWSQNLVLVPLPATFWAATSGLTGLALVAAWRRRRLRSE